MGDPALDLLFWFACFLCFVAGAFKELGRSRVPLIVGAGVCLTVIWIAVGVRWGGRPFGPDFVVSIWEIFAWFLLGRLLTRLVLGQRWEWWRRQGWVSRVLFVLAVLSLLQFAREYARSTQAYLKTNFGWPAADHSMTT